MLKKLTDSASNFRANKLLIVMRFKDPQIFELAILKLRINYLREDPKRICILVVKLWHLKLIFFLITYKKFKNSNLKQ